jgi:osmoprotectant transport system ATP-binding protein
MIDLQGVSKLYDGDAALDAVDLTIPAHQTTALIGPSGCGKSTLLRLIAGLVQPDQGSVTLAGQPLNQANLPAIRQNLGYVIQEGGLFPHMTARQNTLIVADHLDWSDTAQADRLAMVGSLAQFPANLLDRYPLELSGGQRQRVALMRALMLDPDILLLDEPLGALDPMIRADLQDELRDIFAQLKKTVVMVTHDMAEALFFGQTIVLMKDGKIVQVGSGNDLLSDPADPFVTKFIQAQRHMALEG